MPREAMWIVVDANESRCELAELLRASWEYVKVRRLSAGDVAIGRSVLVERKTTEDFLASLDDGRLFRQARQLASAAARPILIQEGDQEVLTQRVDEGAYRGALLSLSVGFRIPVLMTRDVEHTAVVIRHIAAQESKRASRRRRREGTSHNRSASASRSRGLLSACGGSVPPVPTRSPG